MYAKRVQSPTLGAQGGEGEAVGKGMQQVYQEVSDGRMCGVNHWLVLDLQGWLKSRQKTLHALPLELCEKMVFVAFADAIWMSSCLSEMRVCY